jgi:hypothetical protein
MRAALGQQAVLPDAEVLEQAGRAGLVAMTRVGIAIAGSENSDTKSSGNSGTTGRGRRR